MAKKTEKKAGRTIKMAAAATPFTVPEDQDHADKVADALTAGDDTPFTGSRDSKAWYSGTSCSPRIFQALIEVEHAQMVFNESKFDWTVKANGEVYRKQVSVNDIYGLCDKIKTNPKLQWADAIAKERAKARISGLKKRLYPQVERGKALVEKARHQAAVRCNNDGEATSPWELEQLATDNFGRINKGYISAGCRTESKIGNNGEMWVNPVRNDKRAIHTEIMLADAEALVGKSKANTERFDDGTYTITDDDNELLGAMGGRPEGHTDTKCPRINMTPEEEEINEAAMLDQIQSAG